MVKQTGTVSTAWPGFAAPTCCQLAAALATHAAGLLDYGLLLERAGLVVARIKNRHVAPTVYKNSGSGVLNGWDAAFQAPGRLHSRVQGESVGLQQGM
jgi:hypothetical protein